MQSTPATLSGRRVTWSAYAYLCVVGFLLYAIGALTPYIRDALHLSAAEAALHSSLLAIGLMVAGSFADAFERRLGRRRAGLAAVVLVVLGGVAIMLGGVLPLTLAGAFAIGLGAGVMLAALNIVLGSPGGLLAETRFARANTWALLSALIAPLLIAGLATSSLGWQAALVVPLLAAVALEAGGGLPSGGRRSSPSGARSLPRSFWVAWLFVVAAVSIEFAYVVWGSSLVAARTGVSRETATALATCFLAGMLAGRVALGAGLIGSGRWRHWVDIALGIAAVGGIVAWLATTPIASAAGLFVAGFGTASLYPQGLATALDRAGDAALAAGARLTLASGLAILAMPLLLGAVADTLGVVAGWPLVIALCAVAFALDRVRTD
jgi:fucose permease